MMFRLETDLWINTKFISEIRRESNVLGAPKYYAFMNNGNYYELTEKEATVLINTI